MTKKKNHTNAGDSDWVAHLHSESDCGCILVVHALLEDQLKELIEKHLLATRKAMKQLVATLRGGRSNPIGSFASCVDYAQSLRLITKDTAQALREINSLRIIFAHYKLPRRIVITDAQVTHVFGLLSSGEQEKATYAQTWFAGPDVPPAIKKMSRQREHSEARKRFMGIAIMLLLELDALTDHEPSKRS